MAKSSAKDRQGPGEAVRQSLSELRTTVLGPQILLGFQYEALFQAGFAVLPAWRKLLSLLAFMLLLATVTLVIAPASFHQLAEGGARTARVMRFSKLVLAMSCGPFALAIGASVVVAIGGELGGAAAIAAGAAAAIVALLLWYGIEMMAKPSNAPKAAFAPDAVTSLKSRVADLMTETRIVLPGVQALLGFQFAAYLTSEFPKLAPDARAAHGLGLTFLLVSMILLMTLAPFHRLAENGRDTKRVCRVGAACIVAALAALAVAFAADFYVAVSVITGRPAVALSAGVIVALIGGAFWFAYPLLLRRRSASAALASARQLKGSA